MDAVVGTLQSPSAIHAASKLAYFDNMKKKRKFCGRAVLLPPELSRAFLLAGVCHLEPTHESCFLLFYKGEGLAV